MHRLTNYGESSHEGSSQNLIVLSFALPVFNDSFSLGETIMSITQEIGPFENEVEILVSDNNSEDDATSLAANLLQHTKNHRIVRQQSNLGFAGNLRELTSMSKGRYIWFIGAGDTLVPGSLSALVLKLREKNWAFGTVMTLFNYHRHGAYTLPQDNFSVGSSLFENEVVVFSHAISSNIFDRQVLEKFFMSDSPKSPEKSLPNGVPEYTLQVDEGSERHWPHLEAISSFAQSSGETDFSWFEYRTLTVLLKNNKNGNWDQGPLAMEIFLQWIEVAREASVNLPRSIWLRRLARHLSGNHFLAFVFMLRKDSIVDKREIIRAIRVASIGFLTKATALLIAVAPRTAITLAVTLRSFLPKPPDYHRE